MRSPKMDFNFLKLAVILIISLYCQLACAENFESMDNLQSLAKDFTIKNTPIAADETINVTVSPLTSQFAKCSNPIEASLPMNTNRDQITGVTLSCNGSQSWQTLIPVNVEIYTKVVVARQTILPKQTITEVDLDLVAYDKNHLYASFFKNKEEVIGQVAAHLLTPGTVLTRKNLQAPIIIHKNEIVSITAKNNVISVTMQGVAKTDGALNDSIQVYNPSSKRTLDAIVTGPSKAEIIV